MIERGNRYAVLTRHCNLRCTASGDTVLLGQPSRPPYTISWISLATYAWRGTDRRLVSPGARLTPRAGVDAAARNCLIRRTSSTSTEGRLTDARLTADFSNFNTGIGAWWRAKTICDSVRLFFCSFHLMDRIPNEWGQEREIIPILVIE